MCWGTFVFMVPMHSLNSMFLVRQPDAFLPFPVAFGLTFFGLLCIYATYDADNERLNFRASGGKKKIWGKEPLVIQAEYVTEFGEKKSSLLLASGYHGISRHFNYLPEFFCAICWTLPVLTTKFLPNFYIPYLFLILIDRIFRDDARCRSKYQKYWEDYCRLVPWKIIPYVF